MRPIGATLVSPACSEIRFLGLRMVGLDVWLEPDDGEEPSVIEGPSAAFVFCGLGRDSVAPAAPATAACPPPRPRPWAPARTATPVASPTARATPIRARSPEITGRFSSTL